MSTRYLLAADIGGTNSRFALFVLDSAPGGLELHPMPGGKLRLPTARFGSFSELLGALRHTRTEGGLILLDGGLDIAAVSMAVPGAVHGSGSAAVCHAPNIAWPLSAAEAEAIIPAPVFLINDFAAQGQSCLFPEVLGLRPVVPGEPKKNAPSVILGAGTGLGKAIILPPALDEESESPPAIPAAWDCWASPGSDEQPEWGTEGADDLPAVAKVFVPTSGRRPGGSPGLSARVLPSEGGHSVFPFKGEEEAAFERFLTRVSGRREIIGDMAVTGHGLAALYAFHNNDKEFLPPPQVTPLLPRQPKALEWMARFYGRACRNMVFDTLALGGVYLSGGMLSHVPGLLGHPAFIEEFRASESQPELIGRVPVWWVSNQNNGLWGAALYGVDRAPL